MKKIERKDFLMLTGGAAAGAAVGTVFSGAPFLGLQWLVEWTQDQYVAPKGKIEYMKSVCGACGYACEVSVRKAGDRAVKIETSNSGCPFGQSALQMLYHPERINTPMKLDGKKGSGNYTKISWETAIKEISAKMNTLVKAGKGSAIAGISKDMDISSALLERLIKSAGSANHYFEPSLAALNSSALGADVEYDFDNTDYVLSFGAKLFEGWGNMARMNKVLIKWKEKGVKFVQIDTNVSRTASMADEFVPVKPGTEMILALSIASVLVKKGRGSAGTDFAKWSGILKEYEPAAASKITGVPEAKIIELADMFAKAKNPAAVGGKGAKGVSSSAAEIIAVYSLNDLVKTRAVTLKEYAGYNIPGAGVQAPKEAKASAGLDDFIKNGSFEMLFINSSDPAYKSVYGKELIEKLKKSFVVATASLINDSALYADYILPTLTFIDSATSAGDAAVKLSGQSKHAGDLFIDLGKECDLTKDKFLWNGCAELVKAAKNIRVKNGFAFKADALKFSLDEFKKAESIAAKFPLYMVSKEIPFIGAGEGLAFPYVLKTIDIKTYSDGRLWVEINSKTAKEQGVREGSSIKIESERGKSAKVYIHVTDTAAPGVVAVPAGFGQLAGTNYAKGKGINPKGIMANAIDPVTGNADWSTTRVKIN